MTRTDAASRLRFTLDNASKRYAPNVVALDRISIDFCACTTTALIGSSGSGKSTVLRLLLGLDYPDSGRVTIDDRALAASHVMQLRRRVGYVIQEGGLFPHLNVLGNLALLPRQLGWNAGKIRTRAEELAVLTHLPHDALARYPAELSGGQRQRVALIRGLMADPDALLLDEPLGALDPIVRHELQDELKRIFEQLGKTVIIVTHDLAEAAWFADRLVLLRDGAIVQDGGLRDLREHPADPFVTRFVEAQRRIPRDAAMNRATGLRMLALALLLLPLLVEAVPVRIGSKVFTESVILGELAKAVGTQAGVDTVHQRELGGTSILWRALRQGDIDVYSEYTGTITHELLKSVAPDADIPALRAALEPLGIGITDSLGFNNTYAIGMLADRAAQLHISKLSDLAAHPDLRFGFSNEFIDRTDGWPGLRQRYVLSQAKVQGLDHSLSYRAVASGAVDAIDLYSTDAEIPYYHLRTLVDDRHYFPRYEAVYLYRLALGQSSPRFVAALNKLAGRIDENTMRQMNAKVKLQGEKEDVVVAAFLGIRPDTHDDQGLWSRLLDRSIEHIRLVTLSLGMAVLLAIPLGILAARLKRLGQVVIGLTGVLQTVPSLAMFVFMIPIFGIGTWPAIAALFLYSLLPIVRNTHAGLVGIAPELRESAAALGLSRGERLRRIELPLATRSILAGIKTAAVINVGTATLAALIGAGGYGQPILTGIRLDNIGLILEGAIPAAILALLAQGVFEAIERWMTPRGLRLEARQ